MTREPTIVESRHKDIFERLPEAPPPHEDQGLKNLADDLCRTFDINMRLLLRFAVDAGEINCENPKEAAQHCFLLMHRQGQVDCPADSTNSNTVAPVRWRAYLAKLSETSERWTPWPWPPRLLRTVGIPLSSRVRRDVSC